MHQDDQGRFCSRSKFVLIIEGGRWWRPPSASHAGAMRPTRLRRWAPPTERRSSVSVVPSITSRRWRRAASPPAPGSATVPPSLVSMTMVRREDFERLYGQFLDPRDPSRQTYLGSPPRGERRAGRHLPGETDR